MNTYYQRRAAGLQAAKTRFDREKTVIAGSDMSLVINALDRLVPLDVLDDAPDVRIAISHARLLAVRWAMAKAKRP